MYSVKCDRCGYNTTAGGILSWIYICTACPNVVTVKTTPMRYDKPQCPACSYLLPISQALTWEKPWDVIPCPRCAHKFLKFQCEMHISFDPMYPVPTVGDLIHGQLRNDNSLEIRDIPDRFVRLHEPFTAPVKTPLEFEVVDVQRPLMRLLFKRVLSWEEF
jgi:DNA-directed RNA polymerase subunit RPC12/RpoP